MTSLTNTSIQASPSLPLNAQGSTPDDDTTEMNRAAVTHLRRKSSHISRWIDEQHRISTTDRSPQQEGAPFASTQGDAQHTSPQARGASLRDNQSERSLGESFVLVDDVPRASHRASGLQSLMGRENSTPRPSPSHTPRTASPRPGQKPFRTASPLRSFHLSFAARRPPSTLGATRPRSPTHPPARPRHSADAGAPHSRAPSLSSLCALARADRAQTPDPACSRSRAQTAWKLRRPTVIEQAPTASADGPDAAPPRPSLSSSMTQSSYTSYSRASFDGPALPRKLNLGSTRAPSPALFGPTSPSLWSLPTNASHMDDAPDSEKIIAKDRDRASTVRIPLAIKVPTGNGGNVAATLGSPRRAKKKRKLVISGIPAGDERRFAAVKQWCESFGEINQIVRVPNGDLHVDFRKAEVADTVCRLQARVYISGVGSVCLSYFTGKKPRLTYGL
ncbi:hypothetical protein WOLCODRAFT_135447 [Wolfiporia cocos MD-104 SS10]|uniref:RRM domain-containing protein n=1 Tax=Wolfiporia cocos (strain MD-104) TaxID=742152 RepID=A0A2H3IWA1_WOLCO|nr:hypothetical protein WOLCODRAFT_135447 [Wolfiporia cocos MD-104 SS10]